MRRWMALERELGGIAEKHRALDNADAQIRVEVRDGFVRAERAIAAVSEQMARDGAHTRGELVRMREEMVAERTELRGKFEATMTTLKQSLEASVHQSAQRMAEISARERAQEVADQNKVLAEEIDRSRKTQRTMLLIAAGVVIVIQNLIEAAPPLLELMGRQQ